MAELPAQVSSLSFLLKLLLILLKGTQALVFLSDVSTPAFVLDVSAIQRSIGDGSLLPPLLLPDSNKILRAHSIEKNEDGGSPQHTFDTKAPPLDLWGDPTTLASASGETCYGFVHARVVQPRTETFIAELDVPDTLDAHLVLGLNNHHVGSYYWARSAGAGAGMEAPGIVLQGNMLCWESTHYKDCNSNDGKRAEWANFLRQGDQVQLRPTDSEETLLQFDTVYGVSSSNRPLGAEPVVVCEYGVFER